MRPIPTDIELSDFRFTPAGYGHYRVVYRDPDTGKTSTIITDNMPLIDATKNADDFPTREDLINLKNLFQNEDYSDL